MHLDPQQFHFFKNKEIDSLFLTIGLADFGSGLVSIFVPVYLWDLGFPLWKIFYFYFLMSAWFLLLTALLIPLLRRLSDKLMMFLGIPFVILHFYGLTYLTATTAPWLFYTLPALIATGAIFFNVGYHADFSASLDKEDAGKEVGMQYMVSAAFRFAAPFVGGTIISLYGFSVSFNVGIAVLFLSVLPLFLFPKRTMGAQLTHRSVMGYFANKSIKAHNISSLGYAVEFSIGTIVWPLFLYLVIGNIQELGGIVSIGSLLAAVSTLIVGFLSDKGKRRAILTRTVWLRALLWIARIPMHAVSLLVGMHIATKMIGDALMVTWSSQYYKIARVVSEPVAFILSREILYHCARVIAWPILMLLAYFVPSGTLFALSFLIAGLASLLMLQANRLHLNDLSDGFLIKETVKKILPA